MTSLPEPSPIKLGLVIDLDICVGCQACVVNCKEWNTAGYGAPLSDDNAYGANPSGAWLNRVHAFEAKENRLSRTVHFPKSCLHFEDSPCVTVCPKGASFKRSEDGIVLVNEEWCIGCGLCAWACPYGAREMDPFENVMKKCTLCVDRIYNENLLEEDRVPACVRTCQPTHDILVILEIQIRTLAKWLQIEAARICCPSKKQNQLTSIYHLDPEKRGRSADVIGCDGGRV